MSSLPNEFQRISAGVYAFKRIVPVEDLLAQIGRDLEIERALSQEDRQGIAKAYDSLLDDAVTEVIVPTDEAVSPSDTTLGKIVNSLNARAREYGAAVSELQCSPDDQRVLNEVLRIAYNFSTDVLPRRLKRQPYARRNFCAPQRSAVGQNLRDCNSVVGNLRLFQNMMDAPQYREDSLDFVGH